MAAAAPSLTEWLRARSDGDLAQLLRRRPDLALPAPADLAALASRLSVRTSVQRAVDTLDAFALRILEALVLAADEGACDVPEARRLLGEPPDFDRGVEELIALALVWGDSAALHVVSGVREAVGTYPTGLGRPAALLLRGVPDVTLAPVLRALGLPPAGQPRAGAAVADVLRDADRVRELLAGRDVEEREILDRLAAGPPVGTVRGAYQLNADRLSAPQRLAVVGLLVPIDASSVELPREVGCLLREIPAGRVDSEPPEIAVTQRLPSELDRAGGTAVLDTLRLVDALAASWTAHPAAQLRSGGVGVRDLRRTARDLDVPERTVALLAETATAAGLLNATHEYESVYLPTPEFDDWSRRPPATRWTALAEAWLAMTRQPSAVSQRGERDRVIAVLGPDAERGTLPALRRAVLAVLAALPPGGAPTHRDDVLAHLAWRAPRRAAEQRPLAEALLAEADLLGITVGGGLPGYSRTLLAGSRAVAEQVLADALPTPVDEFVVQPDLTLVVPGPPAPQLARDLALLADLESSGGASVYRISEATVRRALDAGRTAAELHALLTQRSRTPIPQALQYLIDDAARRHGTLRTGVAGSYLRSGDEALLARVIADRDVAGLDLRLLAPTVAVSPAPVARLLGVLREAGYAPAAETPGGDVVALGAEPPRAPSRPPARPIRARGGVPEGAQLADLVRRVRAGDELSVVAVRAVPPPAAVPGVTSATIMGTLRDAIRSGQQVLLGCAEADGTLTRHTLLPISMGGGYVRGHEPDSERLQSYPLHRLTAVAVLDEPTQDPA